MHRGTSQSPPSGEPSASGEPASPFCGHCGRRADMAAIGPQVGLCHCPHCRSYSCRWCWADASGDCPECGFGYEEMAIAAALAVGRPPTTPRYFALGLVAFGALIVAMALFVFMGPRFGPTEGSERGTGSPTDAGRQSGGLAGVGSPSGSPIVSAGPSASGAAGPSATVGPRPNGTEVVAGETSPPHGVPTATPTSRVGATPTPVGTPTPIATPPATPQPTPIPTPRPTPTPSPRPTPSPTPSPTPPPSCRTVPNLVGLSVANARAAWTGAGFTGSFDPVKGHDLMVVLGQSAKAGACLPATAGVTVTYSKTPA
jgi:PASTA domain